MQNIKEIYHKIESWTDQQILKKIEFLTDYNSWETESELGRLKATMDYYNILKECDDKKYLFGEALVTLKDISDYMLKNMGSGDDLEDEDEDLDGYADKAQFLDIRNFWTTLTDQKLRAAINGSVEDDYEIDLQGGRCYFMTSTKVFPLIFNYVFYTLKQSIADLEETLYNDNVIFDDIIQYYPPVKIFLPDSSVVEKLYVAKTNEQQTKVLLDFEAVIKNIVTSNKFTKEPLLKEKLESLKALIN